MEAFLTSTGIVALAEMGDKTQLLALLLAARFKKPWPIVWGILVATLANHALAGAVGAWVSSLLSPQTLRWILGASFLALAVWMLIPDKIENDSDAEPPRWGVFGTTTFLFFLAEMGDKTQVATVMLAARFDAYLWVVAGTTLGMMLANAPVVWLGERVTRLLPLRVVHSRRRWCLRRWGWPRFSGLDSPDILAIAPICSACGRLKSTAKDESQDPDRFGESGFLLFCR